MLHKSSGFAQQIISTFHCAILFLEIPCFWSINTGHYFKSRHPELVINLCRFYTKTLPGTYPLAKKWQLTGFTEMD